MLSDRALLSLDPSIHSCGVARWIGGSLCTVARVLDHRSAKDDVAVRAKWVAREVAGEAWAADWDLASEYPQGYSPGKNKGPTGDLLPMVLVVGGVAALCPGQVTTYLPAEWCRNLPKTLTGDPRDAPRGARIWDRLRPDERAVAETLLQHDVWDAIGIGLRHLGRFAPRRGSKS